MNIYKRAVKAIYEAAFPSRKRSTPQTTYQSAHLDISKAERRQLQSLARSFERDKAIVNVLADVWECYTVGTGLIVHPSSSNPAWNDAAKQYFTDWCEFADLTSRQSFGTLQGLITRGWFIDGESFVLLTYGDSGRPRIQLVEAHRVVSPTEMIGKEGSTLFDGVGTDSNGRPTTYYIADNQSSFSGVQTVRPVDALGVIHVFEPHRPGQYRGIPIITPVINDIIDLNDLQALEMQAAKVAAEITNVVNTESGEVDDPAAFMGGKTEAVTDSEGRVQYFEKAAVGRTVYLRTNEKMEQFRSERPSVATSEYWKFLAEKICVGSGIPYVLAFPSDLQGTVFRGTLERADAFFRARSQVMQDVCRRIYAYVIGYGIKTESSLRNAPKDWARVTIHPPRSPNVDYLYNAQGALSLLKAGAMDYSQILGPLGHDWREVMKRLSEQKQYAKELGLDLEIPGLDPNENKDTTTPPNES